MEIVEDEQYLLVQSRDNCIRLVELSSKNILNRYFKGSFANSNTRMFLSRDKRLMVCGNENGIVRVWEVVTGNMVEA